MYVFVPIVSREYNKARLPIEPAHGANDFDSTHPGKSKVDDANIGTDLAVHGDCFFTVSRLANDFHILLGIDQCDKPIANDRVIFNNQHTN
jgi:hypothetical protein